MVWKYESRCFGFGVAHISHQQQHRGPGDNPQFIECSLNRRSILDPPSSGNILESFPLFSFLFVTGWALPWWLIIHETQDVFYSLLIWAFMAVIIHIKYTHSQTFRPQTLLLSHPRSVCCNIIEKSCQVQSSSHSTGIKFSWGPYLIKKNESNFKMKHLGVPDKPVKAFSHGL